MCNCAENVAREAGCVKLRSTRGRKIGNMEEHRTRGKTVGNAERLRTRGKTIGNATLRRTRSKTVVMWNCAEHVTRQWKPLRNFQDELFCVFFLFFICRNLMY